MADQQEPDPIQSNVGKKKKRIRLRNFNQGLELEDVMKLPPQERFLSSCKQIVKNKEERLKKTTVCPRCWLVPWNCMCNDLKKITTHHHYVVLYHPKEWLRSTNTGLLLTNVCDEAEQLIYGNEEHMQRLNEIVQDVENTVCMFPSTDSITIEEFLNSKWDANSKQRLETAPLQQGNDGIETNTNSEESQNTTNIPETNTKNEETVKKLRERKLNVIVLDATWSLARNLLHCIPPQIARVHLANPPTKSRSKMRKQASDGRITTAEAIASIFKELCESEEAITNLYHNLDVRIVRVDNQSGRNKVDPELFARAVDIIGYDPRDSVEKARKERRQARLQQRMNKSGESQSDQSSESNSESQAQSEQSADSSPQ